MLSATAGSLLPIQITKPVSSRKWGKIIHHECERAFCYPFFAVGAPCVLISQIFWLKPLKLIFCNLKKKHALNLKIKYQRFKVLISLLAPVKSRWTKPLTAL
jgi:hypothetical protein